MKKTFLLTLSLLMFSCTTIDPSILKPGNNEMSNKLHRLKIGLGGSSIVRSEAEKSVTKQSELLTILERELEANIFDNSRESWG